jgi:pimeloyl-ACP methyl ester carboxylesterase
VTTRDALSASDEPTLVLLSGLLCDEALWHDTLAALDGSLRVETTDLTGQASIEAMADSVLAHAPRRFALAGFSMGGQVAMEVCSRAPQRVARLALMSTNPNGLMPAVRQHLVDAIERVQAEGLQGYLADAFPLYFSEPAGLGDEKTHLKLRDTYLEMANRLGPDVALRQMHALLSYKGTALDFSTVRCPTLVVCGELDARTPCSLHAEMASAMPHATLCVVDGSAHFTLLESPAAVARAMKSWLAR